MNKSYRVVWNESTGAYMAVQETAKAGKKSKSAVVAVALAALLGGVGLSGQALAYVAGTGTVQGAPNNTVVGDGATGPAVCATSTGVLTPPVGGTSPLAACLSSTVVGTGAASSAGATTAIGEQAKANGQGATAVGSVSQAAAYSSAFGAGAIASGDHAVALGQGAYATKTDSSAVGANAWATGTRSLAMGSWAQASADDALAIGRESQASGLKSTSIGTKVTATGDTAIGLGYGSTASAERALAAGAGAQASGVNSVAIGDLAVASGLDSNSFGRAANASARDTLAIGTQTSASGWGAAAIGTNASATQLNALALGRSTKAFGVSSNAIGDQAEVNSDGGTAIGGGAKVNANSKTSNAIGWYAETGGEDAVAIGTRANASNVNAVAVGSASAASGLAAAAFGNGAVASGAGSLATGQNAIASGKNSMASGLGAHATSETGIAIGQGAEANFDPLDPTSTGALAVGWKAIATGEDAAAIGSAAEATKTQAFAMGTQAHARGAASTAIGSLSNANGSGSLAIGNNALADAKTSVAIGQNAKALSDGAGSTGSVAVGWNSAASAQDAIAFGAASKASSARSLAMGVSAEATVATGVALGASSIASRTGMAGTQELFSNTAVASTQGALSVGDAGKERQIVNVAGGTQATDAVNVRQLQGSTQAITNIIGGTTTVDAGGNVTGPFITLGGNTYNTVGDAITNVYGKGTKYFHANSTKADSQATGVDSIAVGPEAVASGLQSTAQGLGAKASGQDSIALGSVADASGLNSVSLGARTTTTGQGSVAIGEKASALAPVDGGAIAIGGATSLTEAASANGNYGIAIGTGAANLGVGNDNTSIGRGAITGDAATGTSANMALGVNAKATGGYSTAVGGASQATGMASTALGGRATGANSVAIGNAGVGNSFSTASGISSVAVGARSKATLDDSVALGSNSVTTTDKGVAGFVPTGANAAESAAIAATTSTLAAVSVGNVSTGKFRQINGLAAGTVDSDAVNVAQLKASVSASTADAVMYDNSTHNKVTMGGPVYNNSTHVGGTTITNVADGVDPSDAVNVSQLTTTNNNVTNVTNTVNKFAGDQSDTFITNNGTGIKYVRTNEGSLTPDDAHASAEGATAVGYNAQASAADSLALGRESKASSAKGVALGSSSVADRAGLNGAKELFSNTVVASTQGAVSVGDVGKERQITNVAGGTELTDAVNVRQLKAVEDGAVKYDKNPDGTINTTHVTLGGPTYNNSTHVGGTTITNVADGVDPSDAVNVSQLTTTNNNVTNVTNTVNQFAGDQSDTYIANNGTGIKYVRTNDTGLPNADTTADAHATVAGATAVGYEARATHNQSVALGRDSLADGSTLGAAAYNPSTTATIAGIAPVGEVSIGSAGKERRITNLAAGANDTDGVNVSQLKALDSKTTAADAGNVKYDVAGGVINYNSVTLGGPVSIDGGVTGGTTITNVHQGAVNATSTDAINGAQLYNIAGDTSTTYITNNGKGIKYVRTNDTGLPNADTTADAHATVAGATAVGYEARATHNQSVALGRDSLADGSTLGAAAYNPSTTTTIAGITPVGEVSIGSAGKERRITNLAAGANDTDAVNVSQLKAVDAQVDQIAQDALLWDATKGAFSASHGGVTVNKITNVADGDISATSSDAINGSQLYDIAGDTSNTYITKNGRGIRYARTNDSGGLPEKDAYAEGQGSTALGYEATSEGESSLAVGRGAKASNKDDVALGSNSTTALAVGTANATIGGTLYNFAGVNPQSTVSVGSVGAERTITNVAAGRLSATSTDAVNGSQLYASNQAIEQNTTNIGDLDKGAVKYDKNPDGSINYEKVTLNPGGAPTTITNVKDGEVSATSTDAVNGSQLHATNTHITNVENKVDAIGDTVNNINNGGGIRYFRHNVSDDSMPDAVAGGVASVAVGSGATTTAAATNGVAMGMNATVDAANGLALGSNTSVTVANSVALGAGAVANKAAVAVKEAKVGDTTYGGFAGAAPVGVVSVGAQGAERQITNVAAGQVTATSTDAINGSQLYSVADGLGKQIQNVDAGSVHYDKNVDGSVNHNSVTLEGDGGTQIHNVADGAAGNDAVNVNQLNGAVAGINQQMNGLSNRIENVNKDANAGTAGAMAIATLPQATLPGKSMASAGIAAYQGEVAMAIGVSKLADNARWVTKLSGTVNTRGKVGVAVGAGFHW